MYVGPHSMCSEQLKDAYPSQKFIRSMVNYLTARASSLSLSPLYFSLHLRSELSVRNKEHRLVVRVQKFSCPGILQNGNILMTFQIYAWIFFAWLTKSGMASSWFIPVQKSLQIRCFPVLCIIAEQERFLQRN